MVTTTTKLAEALRNQISISTKLTDPPHLEPNNGSQFNELKTAAELSKPFDG